MAILQLDLRLLNQRGSREHALHIEFSAGNAQQLDGVVFEYTATSLLHTGKSQVFKGNLRYKGCDFGHEIVCKVAEKGVIPGLKKEAQFYTTVLKDLCDSHVPYFLCYATGISAYSGKPIACLLTRYCGEPPRGSDWLQVLPEIRHKAFLALIKLHLCGVCHNDFTPDNTVIDGTGDLVVIDFDRAVAGHNCSVMDREYELYEDEPSRCELNCGEVLDISRNMDIWTPIILPFKGLPIPMSSVSNAEDIVNIARDRLPSYSDDDARREAELILTHYRNFYLVRQKATRRGREISPFPAIGGLISQLQQSSLAEYPVNSVRIVG